MKLAIVGVFYSGYVDLWMDFLNLYQKNIGFEKYPLYVISDEYNYETLKEKYQQANFISAGVGAEYSKKVQEAINNIDADYYLILLEDFFISKKVDLNYINEIMNFIEDNNIDYYTMPIPEFVDKKERKKFSKDSKVFKINKNKEYVLSCQPSIWRKGFLKLCIGIDNYNAWIFEGIFARTECVRNDKFLEKCVIDYRNPLNLLHGAVQGKMIRKTVKLLKKSGYQLTTNRSSLTTKQTLIRGFKKFVLRCLSLVGLKRIISKYNKKSILERYRNDIIFFSERVINQEKIDKYIIERDELK